MGSKCKWSCQGPTLKKILKSTSGMLTLLLKFILFTNVKILWLEMVWSTKWPTQMYCRNVKNYPPPHFFLLKCLYQFKLGKWAVMYLCVRGINLTSYQLWYIFCIWFWNCSHSLVFFVFRLKETCMYQLYGLLKNNLDFLIYKYVFLQDLNQIFNRKMV